MSVIILRYPIAHPFHFPSYDATITTSNTLCVHNVLEVAMTLPITLLNAITHYCDRYCIVRWIVDGVRLECRVSWMQPCFWRPSVHQRWSLIIRPGWAEHFFPNLPGLEHAIPRTCIWNSTFIKIYTTFGNVKACQIISRIKNPFGRVYHFILVGYDILWEMPIGYSIIIYYFVK